MGKPYQTELSQIPATVHWALEQDVTELRRTLMREFGAHNLIAVGSGGSLVAASFAAMLHEAVTGRFAKALTPLESITRPYTRSTAALLLSARGTNNDIRQAAKILVTRGYDGVSAISTRIGSPLARILSDYGAKMHEFTVPSGRDGFLATNSLIATLVLLHRATSAAGSYCDEAALLPSSRSALNGSQMALSNRTLVVLAQGWAAPAALDLETRFSEAALANISVTDPRNFAHGRHNWLSFHAEDTGIVSLETLDSQREATRMLRYLPEGIRVLRVQSPREGPTATIELVATVMELAGQAAETRGVDPGCPAVSDFGRRLYRSGSTRRVESAEDAVIAKKRGALFLTPRPSRAALRNALQEFVRRLGKASFTSLAVDYDGTLCARDRRFEPLGQDMQAELTRLLDQGMYIGVASGRGDSVYERLRESLPQKHWCQVMVGLYNGATVGKLADDTTEPSDEIPRLLSKVASRLRPLEAVLNFDMVIHRHQLSLRPADGPDPYELRTVAIEHLAGIQGVKAVASSHSVDILPAHTSKTAVVDALRSEWPGCVLRVGDQGSAGGNDFELLGTGLSLSVDRVSSNLLTCWNLGDPGLVGPPVTLQYLRALKKDGPNFRLEVSRLLGGRAG